MIMILIRDKLRFLRQQRFSCPFHTKETETSAFNLQVFFLRY